MRTKEAQSEGGRRRRRSHENEFKADAVAEATLPGVSMASVALARGINANLPRRWVREAEASAVQLPCCPPGFAEPLTEPARKPPAFVPMQLPAAGAPPDAIQLEIRRAGLTATLSWPAGLAAECGACLRELLR